MKIHKIVFPVIMLLVSCSQGNVEQNADELENADWLELIDRELTHWDSYLSYQHRDDYNGTPPKDSLGEVIDPIGLNPEGYDVFTTLQEGEDLLIRVSGEYYGCLISREEFENYHFQLKYKWGDLKWTPRKEKLMDSGILYHSVGPPGIEYWRSWMLSQEFQIMEGHSGDFWGQSTSEMDIRAYKPEGAIDPLAHKSQDYIRIGWHSPYKNYCRRSNNYENAKDEWNTLDLYCFEGKSLHMVNGEVVMILKNSRYVDENGESHPLTRGKIQLQSEAAELFFKDIKIREIKSLSEEQQSLF